MHHYTRYGAVRSPEVAVLTRLYGVISQKTHCHCRNNTGSRVIMMIMIKTKEEIGMLENCIRHWS
jgi:hypothetical protein